MLSLEKVSAVYSGRPGCACGCRGKHTSKPVSIRRIVEVINAAEVAGEKVEHEDSYVAFETPSRLYIAYTDGRVS